MPTAITFTLKYVKESQNIYVDPYPDPINSFFIKLFRNLYYIHNFDQFF